MAVMRYRSGTLTGEPYAVLLALIRWTRRGIMLGGALVLLALWVGPNFAATPHPERAASHIALDILPIRPGGPAQDYAAYLPSTALYVPARIAISVTIRNFDLDPTPVPVGSPYTQVLGTLNGVAYADGVPYTGLDRMAIAHTFTVPGLHLNVPIPGRSASGKPDVAVTFSFRSSGPGVYQWKCFDPCGDGPDGLDGPMANVDYMRGSLAVEP